MKTVVAVLLLVALLLTGCGQSTAPDQKPQPAADGNLVSAPTDYLKSTAQSQQRAVKTVDLAALNKAVESFYIQEGRFPKTLEELQEKNYLRTVPPVPSGMKFNYDATNGVVTLEKE